MESITQTINIVISEDGLANTGASTTLYTAIGVGLIIVAVLFLLRRTRNLHFNVRKLTKNRSLSFRSFSIFFLLALFTASLALSPLSNTLSATPTLTLGANQESLTVTVPEGGGEASTTTTLTSGTVNPDGYTLAAALDEPEPGIDIKLKGGDVTTSTPLEPGSLALTLKTTDSASSNDTTEVTLDFTIDSTVTPGEKELKLAYTVTDNEPIGPATLQSFTTEACDALPVYTGSNEEAVITLHDPRGEDQDYQVAKLADGNCWMLENLKLGSTTSTTTLTPADTNIAANFTLPQVVTGGTADYDNPGAYGPVPGDTGSGSTNYGYLYNWSAATAGESRTSHDETAGDAPYSICPAGWRLPTGGGSGEFAALYTALDSSAANWSYPGAFQGTFAGYWWGGFYGQGGNGFVWSGSASPGNPGNAFYANFVSSNVSPSVSNDRALGSSVRCLLQ